MRVENFLNGLLSLIIVFSFFSCNSSAPSSSYYIKDTGSMLHADKHTQVLQRRIGNLEMMMGVRYKELEYYIPGDKKLIVTMKAEFNGEIQPGLSGHFHIPPPRDAKKRNEGLIAIVFYDSPFQSKEPIRASWTYQFSCPASNQSHSHSASSPFKLFPGSGPSWSTVVFTQNDLAMDKEYEVLKLTVRGDNKPGSVGENKQWSYSLIMSIRLATPDDTDARDKVTRVEL
ncbi:MAG: hypothetical protein PVH61_19215 [Candidatus Aminicenantes bacterium]|jgi:hypothetical protein